MPTRAVPLHRLLFAVSGALGAFSVSAAPLPPRLALAPRPVDSAELPPEPEPSTEALEALLLQEVSTVSRKPETWWSAPGAIDIVSDEDIRRSGVTTLPEALRLANGVHVARLNETTYAVGIRGFNTVSSNKINVRLDGRNLFTPFYSGVLWASQDTFLADIDRIEVLRGASGALWGPFAVNGFIQIFTKPAWETQGTLVKVAAGDRSQGFAAIRHGDRIGDSTFYRTYFKYRTADLTEPASAVGPDLRGGADFAQAGFRSDTRVDPDTTLTLQGDIFTDKSTPENFRYEERFGANLSASWERFLSFDSDLQAALHYDYTEHLFGGIFDETRHTVSFSGKHRRVIGAHELQAGLDSFVSSDRVSSLPGATLDPDSRTYTSTGVFVQDAISLRPDKLVLTLGARGEYAGFSGFDFTPSTRLAWTPDAHTTLWAAVSRAVRPPVRIDEDLLSRAGSVVFFQGNKELKPEEVVAHELGLRRRLGPSLGLDLAGFINEYDQVRSYEPVSGNSIPYTFKNTLGARSVGFEASVWWQPIARLRLDASWRHLDFELQRDPDSGDILNGVFDANDAEDLITLSARANLTRGLELDLSWRYVSELPAPAVPSYTALDLRLGWQPRPDWELALVARNLLDPFHPEFAAINTNPREEIARSFLLQATWRR